MLVVIPIWDARQADSNSLSSLQLADGPHALPTAAKNHHLQGTQAGHTGVEQDLGSTELRKFCC